MNKDRMIDRIGDYLIPHTNDYIFDELSESCLERAGLADILTGVPVPVRKTELTGLTNVKIAHNMAVIIGCNINFQYRDSYLERSEEHTSELQSRTYLVCRLLLEKKN